MTFFDRAQPWMRLLRSSVLGILGGWLAAGLSGCQSLPLSLAQGQSEDPESIEAALPAVETAIAQTGTIDAALEYTGTTEPMQTVSVRTQIEGRLLDLAVNVGDPVAQGQVIGQVDERLLVTAVNEAIATLAALRAEVAQAEAEVNAAEVVVEQARVELQQAEADAARLRSLWQEGVVSEQAYELAETRKRTLTQAVASAQERVSTQQQAVLAAQGRVAAQQATVQQVEERRSYSALTSPIAGTVLERVVEPGNLVQPGDEVLKLGDFSAIKVMVQISELQLSQVQVGQSVQVTLDAFPGEDFQGRVARISPAADPTARLVPVEVTMPNRPGAQAISSGLLARVRFATGATARVIVPQSAIAIGGEETDPIIFVATDAGNAAQVEQRSVQVGQQANDQVEILSGLSAGETFVVKSSQPLADGQQVALSVLSETSPP